MSYSYPTNEYKVQRVITEREFIDTQKKIEELELVISLYKRQERNSRFQRNIEETGGYVIRQDISTRLKSFLQSQGINHISQFSHIRYVDIVGKYGFGKTMEEEFKKFLWSNGIRTKPKDQD